MATPNDERMTEWAATFLEWSPVIIGLGLLGIAVIVGLVVMRHMFRRWERQSRDRRKREWTDAWAAGGERLEVEPEEEEK